MYAASADWGDAEHELAPRIARAAGESASALLARPFADRPAQEPVVPFEQQLAALRAG